MGGFGITLWVFVLGTAFATDITASFLVGLILKYIFGRPKHFWTQTLAGILTFKAGMLILVALTIKERGFNLMDILEDIVSPFHFDFNNPIILAPLFIGTLIATIIRALKWLSTRSG